ncbi:T9SS type A sorting domain-containing protein [candidate division GN15 bacterium]|nr:T9SS type A sorting domain-containing protein [candidate division GN15 bacterium]
MMQRSIYSLLLTSFILVFALSSASAQQVTFGSQTVLRGQSGTLNITVDSPDPVGGFELLFEVATSSGDAFLSSMSVDWDPAFDVLQHRYIDLSDVDNASPDVVRMAAFVADDTDGTLAAGQTVVAQLDFTANASCGGTVDVNGITMEVGNTCDNTSCATTAMTQFIGVDGLVKTPAALGGTIVTIENAAPTIDPIADEPAHHWGTQFTTTATADDDDLQYGYEVLEFSVDGPDGMTINSETGYISWTPTAQQMRDACEYSAEVTVTDSCGASATTSFTVYLWNDAPEITCPTEVNNNVWGYEVTGSVSAVDTVSAPDPGPAPLMYYVVSFNGPGTIDLEAGTGEWSWQTEEDPAYLGDFELCIGVTDGAAIGCGGETNPNNADTCCVQIHVVSTADIVIEKTHNTYQNHEETVTIWTQDGLMPMGGYDFLISYDASALALTSVEPGDLILDCGWEYFEYRQGANGNCGSGCPSGMLRIVAIAEINNGMNHPDCFGPTDMDPLSLAYMKFLVTDDRTFECQYVPISFFWLDCGDNAISSVSGDTLFIDRAIYTYDTTMTNLVWHEEDDVMFPESDRIPNVGAPDDPCLVNEPGKPLPLRVLDFWNGGIDIICADSIDARGDINLNGQANEIADAVLFSNYFVYGLGVFTVNTEGQIAASDVNADGLTLSVADLVYQIRVIVGDAVPYAKLSSPLDVDYTVNDGVMTVLNADLGGALVTVAGNVVPELRADNMEIKYNFDGENTRILIWSPQGESFDGEFLAVDGEILDVELATADGRVAKGTDVPMNFELAQNYPNPFNPTTTISFTLPSPSDYTLTVYNVNGQVVKQFEGSANTGTTSVVWDANDQASGIYFYRLSADSRTTTKKMVLLK